MDGDGDFPGRRDAVSRSLEERAAPAGGRLRAILDEASGVARDDRARFRLALIYPAVVSVLAIVGTFWTTVTSDRLIGALEEAFRRPPIPAMPQAWPSITIGDVAFLIAGLAMAAGLTAWITHLGRKVGSYAGRAVRCDVLAELAEHARGDIAAADRDRLATDVVRAIEPPVDTATSPLVTFAENHGDVDQRVATLRAAAGFYRGLDARQRATTLRLVPLVGRLIAGMAVLLYATALFRPMVGLLDGLAAPRDVIGRGGER